MTALRESSLVGSQILVFIRGNWLSREAFQELSTPAALHGIDFFKLLVRTTIALEGPPAGLLPAVSRNVAPDPVARPRHWPDAPALGHIALLSFRRELAWFAELVREATVKTVRRR